MRSPYGRLAILAATATSFAAPAQSASAQSNAKNNTHPATPYVVHGACPFECCTYTDWTTYRSIPVRANPTRSAPVLFHTRNRERIRGDSGNVIVFRPGVVIARSPLVMGGSQERGNRTAIPRGDTLYVLNYEGEGFWNTWYHGMLQTREEDWDEPGQTYSPGVQPKPARMVQQPKSEWWAHITRKSGAKRGANGWILMDSSAVDGTDACG